MTDTLPIRDNPEAMRFEVEVEGRLAFAEYRLPQGSILFSHTEVPPELEGRGIGSALVRFALGEARERGLKVIPVCPFFVAFLTRHPEEADIVHPDYRRATGLD